MKRTAQDILNFVEDNDVKFAKLTFCDIFGNQKNVSLFASELPRAFAEGVSFDGSSIAGFMNVEESDLVLWPDPDTATVLPWRPTEGRVIRMYCDITLPNGKPFEGNCRGYLQSVIKRARAMGVTDILNQLPLVFKNYIKTDMDISTIAKLVVSFLKIDSSNIILAQTPVFMGVPNVGKTDSFAGYSCVVPDAGSIAALLNQYFCTYTGPIDVSEMHLVTDQWPHGTASTDANVQYMGRIDKESDDAILNGNTDLSGAVTTDGQAAGSAN